MADWPQSICLACAKHPSLRRFIESNGTIGIECGICGRKDQTASRPDDVERLAGLVRALIRFHYDEWDYNHHWGGDETPTSLLMSENPIVEHAPPGGAGKDPAEIETFLDEAIFWPPYPDYDKGIAVYAGHDSDGIRDLVRSIQGSTSPWLMNAIRRLQVENHFEVEPELESRLSKLGNAIDKVVKTGEEFYRARLGTAGRYLPDGEMSFKPKIVHQAHQAKAIGAPPPNISSAGRANREGVSYLYLSSTRLTAAAEIRPHPGHLVSVAAFRANRDARVADFAVDIGDFCRSDELLDQFHFIHSIERTLSTPVPPEDRRRYTITQVISDILRKAGYDGLKFRSSISPGSNLCIFQLGAFDWVPESGRVLSVDGLRYELSELDWIGADTAGYASLAY